MSLLTAALRFFAGGSYQLDVGGNYTVGLSQPSVSRAIHEIIDAFNTPFMLNRFIKFPQTIEELTNIRQRFFIKFGLPGIIGCIDGTHVSIVTPIENEHLYINRKRYHSLNVQIICDEELKITNVNARFPGSTHDSFVWQNSNIFTFLRDLPREHRGRYYLLGDSGYPLRAWMMTPILPEPPAGSPEANYNARIRTIRSSVEMCHGKLKNRFRCLLKDRTLHYSPVTAGQIVNSCAVLHNICIGNNVPLKMKLLLKKWTIKIMRKILEKKIFKMIWQKVVAFDKCLLEIIVTTIMIIIKSLLLKFKVIF